MVRRAKSRSFRSALGIFPAVLGFLMLAVTGRGDMVMQPVDFTPTAYVHLPFLANVQAPSLIPPDDPANETSVATQLNQKRREVGLAEVTLLLELTQASRRHSRDMADNDFTSHTGSDGSDPGQRMADAGYDWVAWGEIIAWGYGGDPSRVVDAWMSSPPHKAIILSATFQDFGVGYVRDATSRWGHYWTVDFGRRRTWRETPAGELVECSFSIADRAGGSRLTLFSLEPCQDWLSAAE
jgi:uncharacterized protein YkwD